MRALRALRAVLYLPLLLQVQGRGPGPKVWRNNGRLFRLFRWPLQDQRHVREVRQQLSGTHAQFPLGGYYCAYRRRYLQGLKCCGRAPELVFPSSPRCKLLMASCRAWPSSEGVLALSTMVQTFTKFLTSLPLEVNTACLGITKELESRFPF